MGGPPGPALRSPRAAPGGADFEAAREAVLDSARERRGGGGCSGRPQTSSWARPQVQAEGLTGAAARGAEGTRRAAGLRRTELCGLSPFYSSGLCLLKARPAAPELPQPSMGPEWVGGCEGKSLGEGAGQQAAGLPAGGGRWVEHRQVGVRLGFPATPQLPLRQPRAPWALSQHRLPQAWRERRGPPSEGESLP